MNSLFILIPVAVVFVAVAVWVLFKAVDNGQFDDLEGPAYSILYDDDEEASLASEYGKQPNDNSRNTDKS
ncbi:cbb3-type cytochrome oxidase assembly protein CcoS [Endozoicomonadaceae bacterium StTr2]